MNNAKLADGLYFEELTENEWKPLLIENGLAYRLIQNPAAWLPQEVVGTVKGPLRPCSTSPISLRRD